jgi:hypothetical protein
MHYCVTCKKELSESEFHNNRHKPSSLQDHCKKHQIQYTDQYYVNNQSMIIEKQKLRYQLKTGQITEETHNRKFKELTGKEPRKNKCYNKN